MNNRKKEARAANVLWTQIGEEQRKYANLPLLSGVCWLPWQQEPSIAQTCNAKNMDASQGCGHDVRPACFPRCGTARKNDAIDRWLMMEKEISGDQILFSS
jgi:hypothetical protein